MSGEAGLIAAFGAGVLSFISPCVLPLIPGYLSFMTGLSVAELSGRERSTRDVLVPSLLFVGGFSAVFVAFGATASVLGEALVQYRDVIEKLAGAALILFGVFMLGIIRVPWLYGEARFDLQKSSRFGAAGALIMGVAFAAGWTPCVGPILGSILALAGSSGSVAQGTLLLLAYSLGLGLPFIAVALLFSRLSGALKWFSRHSLIINRVAGAILIVLGALIFSDRLASIVSWLSELLPFLEV